MEPCIRAARGVNPSSCLIYHRDAVWHTHAPRAGCVQCLDLRGDFGGISSTSHIVQEVGHRGAKTYVLQQDGGDSNVRSEDEAVHSRDAHMAWITRAVPYICHHRAVLHAHVPRAGRVQCLDLQGDFSGISSTSHSVGV